MRHIKSGDFFLLPSPKLAKRILLNFKKSEKRPRKTLKTRNMKTVLPTA
mgnify:CR=1 FL=1